MNTDLTFITRPSDRGQIVSVSYAFDGENMTIIRRTVDRSTMATTFHVRPQTARHFDPANNDAPPRGGWKLLR